MQTFHKKFSYVLLTALLSTSLMACGGDSDNDYDDDDHVSVVAPNQPNNSTNLAPTTQQTSINNFAFSEFNVDDINNQVTGIQREIYSFANNKFSFATTSIFGQYNSYMNKEYDVAEGFFAETTGDSAPKFDNIKVTQINANDYQITGSQIGNNNSQLPISFTLRAFDITGPLNLSQPHRGNLTLEFLDELNDLTRLPLSLNLPQGSLCYATVAETQDKVSYHFVDTNITRYPTLEAFMQAEQINSNSVKRFNVGVNNELPMISYLDNRETEYAILYNGRVYDDVEMVATNTPMTQLECDVVNPIAGDYLENQIRAVYR